MSVSPDGRALVAVGLDAQSRQMVVVWDISALRTGGRVSGVGQKGEWCGASRR